VASFSLAGLGKGRLIPKGARPLELVYGLLQVNGESVLPFTQRMRSVYSPADFTDAIQIALVSRTPFSFEDFVIASSLPASSSDSLSTAVRTGALNEFQPYLSTNNSSGSAERGQGDTIIIGIK